MGSDLALIWPWLNCERISDGISDDFYDALFDANGTTFVEYQGGSDQLTEDGFLIFYKPTYNFLIVNFSFSDKSSDYSVYGQLSENLT